MAFFLIRAQFTNTLEKFLPTGVLANDGIELVYTEVESNIPKNPFPVKALNKLKLKHNSKKYTYKDEPKLFLKLLINYFAGFLISQEQFHPFFIGEKTGTAREIANNMANYLALYGTNCISLEEINNLLGKST